MIIGILIGSFPDVDHKSYWVGATDSRREGDWLWNESRSPVANHLWGPSVTVT